MTDRDAQALLSSARARARARGITFTLTRADVAIPSVCPVLGIPLFRTPGAVTENTPSIDRLIPSQGYVPGNVHVVSMLANRVKSDATPATLRKVADYFDTMTSMTTLNSIETKLSPADRTVLRHMVRAGSVSNVEANAVLRCRSVSRRITTISRALEGSPYQISKERREDSTGQKFTRYHLIQRPSTLY